MPSSFIPIEFQKVREKTQLAFIRIDASYSDTPLSIFASKLSGTPLFIDGQTYPKSARGSDMALLAQLNFSEIPPNDTPLPKDGFLQIFLPTDDDLYGADFEPPEKSHADFVVRYLPASASNDDAIVNNQGSGNLTLSEDALFPVYGEHAIHFSLAEGFAGLKTIECELALAKHPFELLEDISLDENEESQFYENIENKAQSQGHKLLGYPYFIQTDPREDAQYQLLLQIDTDMIDNNDIMWGDDGVAQFFIRPEDLEKKDFSRLWFNWDCF